MKNIKKGCVVVRKSYNKDILFRVTKIIKNCSTNIAILHGITERIEADSPLCDLEILDSASIAKVLSDFNKKTDNKLNEVVLSKKLDKFNIAILSKNRDIKEKVITGKILHLDGDKQYSNKSYYYYKKLGLNAIVKNIPEYKQSKVVYSLLKIYNPDILIVTGHDGMIKKNVGYYDIYNYRNSKHFIDTVKEARRYDLENKKNTVIFAGACQSYFEALISAGANFASSPARILIDFLDPIVVAEKVAVTENYKYITIDDIASEIRDGKKGIDGIGSNGKMVKQFTITWLVIYL